MTSKIKAAEGFDVYPSGPIANNFPWVVKDVANGGFIDPTGGMFGGGKLSFASANLASKIVNEYLFPNTLLLQRNNTNPGGKGVFAISGWIYGDAFNVDGNYSLISIGNSDPTQQYNLLGITVNSASGNNLMFPSNFNTMSGAPILFPIHNRALWVTVKFAYYPTGMIFASYCINGYYKTTNLQLVWNTDAITGTGNVDRLKFRSSSNLSWGIDDMVVQAMSDADADWSIAGANPSVDDIPTLSARRIYTAPVVSNGSLNEWESSALGVPNYLAATNGTNYVIADNTLLATDLYKFSGTTATDINATVYRGSVTHPDMVQSIMKIGSTVSNTPVQAAGNTRFIGIAETDGTTAWTPTTIANAEFGMKEI